MDSKYLSSSLFISDVYIDKFKIVKIIPEGVSDETIREDLQNEFLSCWIPFRQKLISLHYSIIDSAETYFKIKLPNSSFEEFIPKNILEDLAFNLFNDYLKLRLNELSFKEWEKENHNSLLAYTINYRSVHLDAFKRQVSSKVDLENLWDGLILDRFEMKVNKGLRGKLSLAVYTSYSEFVDAAIEFLQANKFLIVPDRSSASVTTLLPTSQTFERFFRTKEEYDQIIGFVVSEQLVDEGQGTLVWKGFRSNAKYEIACFHEALYLEGLTKEKARDDNELIKIAANTFENFTATSRTFRSGSLTDGIKRYRTLLSRFKSENNIILPKVP